MATSDLDVLDRAPASRRSGLLDATVRTPAPSEAGDDLLVLLPGGQEDGPARGWRPDGDDLPEVGDRAWVQRSTPRGALVCVTWERA